VFRLFHAFSARNTPTLKPVGGSRPVNRFAAGSSLNCVRGCPCIAVDRNRNQVARPGMNMRAGKKPNANGSACIAFCLVALSASSWAATTPIYKCLDRNLGLLYTDEPCPDGEQLDIRAGEADPVAVARLERQRDALDQSASQRIADLRAAAPEGKSASRSGYEPVDGPGLDGYGPVYVSDYGIVSRPFMHRHSMQPRKSKPRTRHFAPRPPFDVPRR
jgi:hypothetical protein